jgi:hypothetical protein
MKPFPFDAYLKYIAIKLHFEKEKFDYFQYNGKTKATVQSLEQRSDFIHFVRLCDKFSNTSDIEDLFISNYMYGTSYHIVTLRTQEAYDIQKKWTSKMKSFEYHIQNDIAYLHRKYENVKSITHISPGKYPPIIQEVLFKQIHVETLVVFFMQFPKFLEFYDIAYTDIQWTNFSKKLKKFSIICSKYDLQRHTKYNILQCDL